MISRLRNTLLLLLHLEDTPHRVALAFAIGVWIAFSPLLGIHTWMALGIAFLFRLSRAAILFGAYLNNPWTLAPMYMAGTVLGCWMLDVPTSGLTHMDWSLHGHALYTSLVRNLRPYLWPYVLGNTVLGVAAAIVGYAALRVVLERRSRTAGRGLELPMK